MDEFDRLLYEGSAQLPPELSELAPPRPWKKPIGQICWGLALITITLNFFGLNIILPAVGAALLWLGLHRADGQVHPWIPPPSSDCKCLRMRYSFPSTARTVRPDSAAIWAVGW